jgi:hypothetical protein
MDPTAKSLASMELWSNFILPIFGVVFVSIEPDKALHLLRNEPLVSIRIS